VISIKKRVRVNY